MPKKPLYLILSCAVVFSCDCALAHAPRRPTPEMLALLSAQMACRTADNTMRENMDEVAANFSSICRKLGRFPETHEEYESARDALAKLAKDNPYTKDARLTKALPASDEGSAKTRSLVAIFPDCGMYDTKISYWRQFGNADWQAYPGSIGIVHNQDNQFLIWGAGIDGAPLRDADGSMHLVVVRPFDSAESVEP